MHETSGSSYGAKFMVSPVQGAPQVNFNRINQRMHNKSSLAGATIELMLDKSHLANIKSKFKIRSLIS